MTTFHPQALRLDPVVCRGQFVLSRSRRHLRGRHSVPVPVYPVGLTPRQGVERMLPNHALDLAAGRLARLWPRESLPFDGDPAAITQATADVVSRAMGGVGRVHPLQIPLTAGLDSRLLLACSRESWCMGSWGRVWRRARHDPGGVLRRRGIGPSRS